MGASSFHISGDKSPTTNYKRLKGYFFEGGRVLGFLDLR